MRFDPSKNARLELYRRHKHVAEQIGKQNLSRSWEIVVYFYSALHLLQAFLMSKNHRPRTHAEREQCLTLLKELRTARVPYQALSWASTEARYTSKNFSVDHVDEAKKQYAEFERELLALLGS